MEILVKKTTEEKVEIELPYYCKNEWFAFAILNEKKAIQVHCGANTESTTIDICHAKLPFEANLKCIPCTRGEFKTMYESAILRLDTFLNGPFLPEIQN